MTDAASGAGSPEGSPEGRQPRVHAVVVSHDGERWLPAVLDGVAAQTRAPDAVVAVDTSSSDGSADLLRRRLGPSVVGTSPASTGYGAAVDAGLDLLPAADPTATWLWLLHDDSAPAPDALEQLLAEARDAGDVAIVGPKLREWPSLRRLLEVGVTISGTGARETGLERGEPDQGQHDEPLDVLAVNTAGMLIRRDAWDDLGGLERLLPLFGDDLDLGWRAARAGYRTRVAPRAIVFHVEAASRGLRQIAVSRLPAQAQRRRAALITLLVNARPRTAAFQWVRLLIGSLLRVLGFLIAKAPREALGELLAVTAVYSRPLRLLSARRRRRARQRRPPEVVRRLLPSPWLPYRHGADTVGHIVMAVTGGRGRGRSAGRRAVGADRIVPAEAEPAHPEPTGPPGRLERVVSRPWATVLTLLTLLALWSARHLLGEGQLQGGALLPAPEEVADWWDLHLQAWHPVGLGSDDPPAPFVLVLALAATLTLGQPWLLVDLLVLAAVPLCACSAFVLGRSVLVDVRTRLGWAAGYGLLPVLTGAVAQGRIGTLAALLVTPLLTAAVVSTLRGGDLPWWQHAARIGLWLSIATAFAPVSYAVTAAGIVVAAMWWPRRSAVPALLAGLALPWALLGDWLAERVMDVDRIWMEAGRADAGIDTLTPQWQQLAAGVAGGPGHAPVWIGLVAAVGAIVAMVGGDRMRQLTIAWAVATCGLAVAVVGAGQRIDAPASGAVDVPVWVGLPAAVWLAGCLMVLALAADGAVARLAGRAFGRRQVTAALTGALVVVVPVLGALWWARGADTLLERTDPVAVPAYWAAQAAGAQQEATLVLTGSVDDGISWRVVRDDGVRLGEESVRPIATEVDRFSGVVVDLVTNPTDEDVVYLLDHGIAAVLATAPVDPSLAAALDATGGLDGGGTADPRARVWALSADAGSARVVPAGEDGLAGAAVDVSPELSGRVDHGAAPGSLLRLAAVASKRWSATSSGDELEPATTASGTLAFVLGASAPVDVRYESTRPEWARAQLGALALLAVLALPGRRRAS